MLASRDTFPLLAELLAEQQRLDTPVARFSTGYDSDALRPESFAPQLIPLSKPGPGEQYAFEVDLDSCTGCKSCVAACHSLNGLDDMETWRDVGMLVSPSRARPFTQTITTACHHCADPACLNGCPVLAYEKDPVTGIVRHLDDQCIGCSYCILKCPYDVPKFSERLGIVRKCDMCHSRLASGEAPACAQACPTHAIRIVTTNLRPKPETGAPETGNRIPETGDRYRGSEMADAFSPTVDASPLAERSDHPLPVSGLRYPVSGLDSSGLRSPASGLENSDLPYPVSGFASVSAFPDPSYTQPTTRYVTRRKLPDDLVAADAAALRPQPPHWPLVFMLTLIPAAVGLMCAAAFLHPFQSETVTYVVTLSAWLAGLTGLGASAFHLGQPWRAWRIFLGWRTSWLSREALVFGTWIPVAAASLFEPGFLLPGALVGLVGLACSAMVYIDTRRQYWRAAQTVPRFFGTAALFATAPFLPLLAAGLLGVKLGWEGRTFFHGSVSARLQRGPLSTVVLVRDSLGLVSLVLLVIAPGWPALVALLASELAERCLFFRAVDAPKMPGMPA